MMVRLGFAVAAHLDPEILVVDEVLAVGDAEFQKKAIGKMQDVSKGEGRTVLFVSHNMASVKNLCNTGVLLENGQLKHLGSISETIGLYLSGDTQGDNIFIPENNVVKKIGTYQDGDKIKLYLEYDSPTVIKQPVFGWVIFDQGQVPIVGTDPVKSGVIDYGVPKKQGRIEVEISSPILFNGRYIVGVWFSDGFQQLFGNASCLMLDISYQNFDTVAKTT